MAIISRKPFVLPSDMQDLRSYRQWVLWREESRDGKLTKVPYQCNGRKADSTAPHTWCSFEDAQRTFETLPGYDGIGFVLADSDTLVCIDIDCKDPVTGVKVPLTEKQKAFLNYFAATYIELSPGGGYHIWIIAALAEGHSTVCNDGAQKVCEVYSRNRFITVTGRQWMPGHLFKIARLTERVCLQRTQRRRRLPVCPHLM